MSYCTECLFRTENVFRNKKGEIDFKHKPHKSKVQNKSDFCYIGYTQNPNGLEATRRALASGAEICGKNPWKFKGLFYAI